MTLRYEMDRRIIEREHLRHLREHGWPHAEITCKCLLQAGRYRKMDAFDCGVPRCTGCHYYKALHHGRHEPSRQELKADLYLEEFTVDAKDFLTSSRTIVDNTYRAQGDR